MVALVTALAPEFALDRQSYKVFRPYRDVRFAKDKTPYKTNQGAYVAVAPATGWYVEISARGVRTGGGCYDMGGPRLAAYRDAVADDKTGAQLTRITNKLTKAGFELGGETAQDHAARVRRRAPPHRPAAPQVAARGEVLRLREGDPHRGAAGRGTCGLAGAATDDRVAGAHLRRVATPTPAGEGARRGAQV